MCLKIISLDVSASSCAQRVRFYIPRVHWQTRQMCLATHCQTHWQKRVSLLKAACSCCSGTSSQQLPPRYDLRNVMRLDDTDTRCGRWVTSRYVNTPEFCPKRKGIRGWFKSRSALVNAFGSGKAAKAESNLWRGVHRGETVSCQYSWPHHQTNTSSSGYSGSAIRFLPARTFTTISISIVTLWLQKIFHTYYLASYLFGHFTSLFSF